MLHIFATFLFSLLAVFWIVASFVAYRGMLRIPRLADAKPFEGPNFPRVSILFAARNEAEKLPAALASLLALEYPNFEVIAADDRSQDATGQILANFAQRDSRLKVIQISELPPGWLGKPNALVEAYAQATGEWLVFTDADVRFGPDSLRRTLALAQQTSADHLTLLTMPDVRGFWEPCAVGYLGVCFTIGVRPWQISNPKSKSFMGVGAFQLVRRSAYEALGTHRRLAMEVLDDMKLGKLVKQCGFRSSVAPSDGFLQIRWQEGLGNIITGMTKNMFAAFDYSVPRAAGGLLAIFLISILPFAGIFFATDAARIAAGVAVAAAMFFESRIMAGARASQLSGLTHPLGAAVVSYIILRSMVVTLARGGVVWRGTFYPLGELKRGLV